MLKKILFMEKKYSYTIQTGSVSFQNKFHFRKLLTVNDYELWGIGFSIKRTTLKKELPSTFIIRFPKPGEHPTPKSPTIRQEIHFPPGGESNKKQNSPIPSWDPLILSELAENYISPVFRTLSRQLSRIQMKYIFNRNFWRSSRDPRY